MKKDIIHIIGVSLVFSIPCVYADQPTVREFDTDGDGMPEIVLENPFLRVVIDRGNPPPDLAGTVYDDRFVRGGWIRSLKTFPDGDEFFLQPDQTAAGHPSLTGLREEFDTPIQSLADPPPPGEAIRFVKIGIGVFRAISDGTGGWTQVVLEKAPGWETAIEDLGDAGKMITCRQTLESADGPSYSYEKRFLLGPGDKRLTVSCTLTNIGIAPLNTRWTLRPYFAPGDGTGYEDTSRLLVPLKIAPGRVDMTAVQPVPVKDLHVHGVLNGQSIAAPWLAVGTAGTGPWLTLAWHEACRQLQTETCRKTFSAGPVMSINLSMNGAWRLPLRLEVSDRTPGFPETPSGKKKDLKVLIVKNPETREDAEEADRNILKAILQHAGMKVLLVEAQALSSALGQEPPADIVFVPGGVNLSDALVKKLGAYVRNGGGLVTNSTTLMANAPWSPARPAGKTFESSLGFADIHRDREKISDFTLHLTPSPTDPPVFKNIPCWPVLSQDIARARKLEPLASAQVIATFAPGEKTADGGGWPAVVTRPHGKGRIVCVACPVDWGPAPGWINWGRLGDYHRRFWTHAVIWAAGKR